MFIYTFLTVVSILWLSYRLYSFLSLPILSIVSLLQVKIPHATKISIDEVTTSSITIHWENELNAENNNNSTNNNSNDDDNAGRRRGKDKDKGQKLLEGKQKQQQQHISHHLVYINNNQVAIFPNNPKRPYTYCSIGGLEQNTEYQLDLVTVNSNGFVNKVPSVYCVTRSKESKTEGVNDESEIVLNGLASTKNISKTKTGSTKTKLKSRGKIRNKNKKAVKLPSPPKVTKQNSGGTTNGNYSSNSGSNLGSLKELENYSIDDLKKMLICAQEDLHDIIYQQTTILSDFKEAENSLTLELNDLKAEWSQSAEFSKSMRSRIKSLEDAKLLSDLKAEKINRKVEQSRLKIKRMHSEIEAWELEERDRLDVVKLNMEYKEEELKLNEEIDELTEQLRVLHDNLSEKEAENKKLGALRRNRLNFFISDMKNGNIRHSYSASTEPKQQQQQQPVQVSILRRTSAGLHDKTIWNTGSTGSSGNAVTETSRLSGVLKQLNEYTSEKTGLLNSAGETFVAQLNDDNPMVREIKEQIRLDQELDQKLRDTKTALVKRARSLEKKLNDVTHLNKQLKTGLFIQPYQKRNIDATMGVPANTIPPFPGSPATTAQGFVLGSGNNINHNNVIPLPIQPVISDQLSTSMSNDTTHTNPLLLSLNLGRKAEGNGPNTTSFVSTANKPHNDDFIPTLAETTSTGINSMSGFPISTVSSVVGPASQSVPLCSGGNNNGQVTNNHSQESGEEVDTAFREDDVDHLLTGLQSMMSDELENVSNYSKDFTSDQLDNYWLKRDDGHKEDKFLPFASLPPSNAVGRSLSNGANTDYLSPPSYSMMASYGTGLSMQPQPSTLGFLGSNSPAAMSGASPSLNIFPQTLPQGPAPQSQGLLTSSLIDSSPFSEHLSLSRSGSLYRNVFDADSSIGSQRAGHISHIFGSQTLPKSQSSSRIVSFASSDGDGTGTSTGTGTLEGGDVCYSTTKPLSTINPQTSGIQQDAWSQDQNFTNLVGSNLGTVNNPTVVPASTVAEHSGRDNFFNFMWNMGSKSRVPPTNTTSSINTNTNNITTAKSSGSMINESKQIETSSNFPLASISPETKTEGEGSIQKAKGKTGGSSWSNRLLMKNRLTGAQEETTSGDGSRPNNSDIEGADIKPTGGKKMSKILPKGGVSGLFKLPTRDTQA